MNSAEISPAPKKCLLICRYPLVYRLDIDFLYTRSCGDYLMNKKTPPQHTEPADKDQAQGSSQSKLGSLIMEDPQSCSTIFSMVQAGLLIIDADTHSIVDANPWALKMIGAPREQVLGAVCHHFVCPAEVGNCPVTDLHNRIDNSERVLLTSDGREVPILKTVSTIELGGKPYLIESFLDISEQLQARKELEVSEERYRDLFENANDLIQMVGPDGTIQYVNRSWKETLGYSDDEISGLTIQNIIHPEHMNICMQAFQKILSGDNIDFIETSFVTRDGREIELEGSINCNFVDGKPVSSRGIFRNVTARKKAERKRAESEQRYQDLFNNVNDLIQLVHPDGTFEYVNPATLKTLGYTDKSFSKLSIFDLVPEDLHEQFRGKFNRLLSGTRTGLVETEFKTRTGRRIPVEGTHHLQYQKNEIVGVRFIWRNIIERKRAARKIQEWNRQLELLVETRTKQLQETQANLLRTGKMAAIGGLVTGTAHELNNPLGGIMNAVDVLRHHKQGVPQTPEVAEELAWLDEIASAAQRCNLIVDDLRKFSEYSDCEFDKVDINQLLDELLHDQAEALLEDDISIDDDRDPDLPEIDGDPVQLKRVFENVLDNARSAIAENGLIEVETRYLQESKMGIPSVEILIKDDGCGIPDEIRGKVFDPFFTTKGVGRGTGLGLSVSYGIVKRHSGEIDIASSSGHGTEVRITLPTSQADG